MSIIELIDEVETKCTSCGQQATVKSLLLKDTKPHRIISHLNCLNCGYNETQEEDCELLDYRVEIACDFTDVNNLHNNIRRMIFVNHRSEISFYEDDNCLFTTSSAVAYVDCIEGLIMRLEESFSNSAASNECLASLSEKLNKFRKDVGFKMTVKDNTGYSRVCPVGAEYTEVQDTSLEELNKINPDVIHRKAPKVEV